MNKENNKMTNRNKKKKKKRKKNKKNKKKLKIARRLLIGKKVWVSPGFITHTEYVVSCANDYS